MGRVKQAMTEIQIALEDRDFVSLQKILNEYTEEEKAYWLLGVIEMLADWQQRDKAKTEPIRLMAFDEWKAEFVPVIYEDSGAECYDHEEKCQCEFLYTFSLEELQEDETHASALNESRVWTWHHLDGTITSGATMGEDLLVTAKPFTQRMEVR